MREGTLMRSIALGLSLFAAMTAFGQSPAGQTDVQSTERAASRPSAPIKALADFDPGEGYAAYYPGDHNIRRDPRTIFSDDFEEREPFAGWTDRSDPERVRLVDTVPHSGSHALAIGADVKAGLGGHLFKRLRIGHDTLFVRFYVRFPSPAEHVQHFVQIAADEPARPFPLGGAGVCPDGGARFATAIEPFGLPHLPAPGAWHLHSYWCEMTISEDGKYWGNDFAPATPVRVATDRWTCVEVMVKANATPTSTDGVQAFWIDGRLAGAYEGFRWRTDPRLKLNGVCLLYHVTEAGARRQGSLEPLAASSVMFDDVVVATRYIGPQRPASMSRRL
jgi:hypothetical protein